MGRVDFANEVSKRRERSFAADRGRKYNKSPRFSQIAKISGLLCFVLLSVILVEFVVFFV